MLSQPNQETQLGQRPRGTEIKSYLKTKHRREARQLSLMGFLDLGGLGFILPFVPGGDSFSHQVQPSSGHDHHASLNDPILTAVAPHMTDLVFGERCIRCGGDCRLVVLPFNFDIRHICSL
jgi:hypothetical protein